jgi:DNA polymerase
MNKLASDVVELLRRHGISIEDMPSSLNGIAKNFDRAVLCNDIYNCRVCSLCKSTQNKAPGEGPTTTSLMIIGESLGEVESQMGRPFVGPAGQLLDKMLEDACLDRSRIYITNSVKCHPPYNANPTTEQLEACASSFLKRELEIVKPKWIVAMGAIASSLFSEGTISSLRGKVIDARGAKVMFTYHPAFVIRKKDEDYDKTYNLVVEDLSQVAFELAQNNLTDCLLSDNQFN